MTTLLGLALLAVQASPYPGKSSEEPHKPPPPTFDKLLDYWLDDMRWYSFTCTPYLPLSKGSSSLASKAIEQKLSGNNEEEVIKMCGKIVDNPSEWKLSRELNWRLRLWCLTKNPGVNGRINMFQGSFRAMASHSPKDRGANFYPPAPVSNTISCLWDYMPEAAHPKFWNEHHLRSLPFWNDFVTHLRSKKKDEDPFSPKCKSKLDVINSVSRALQYGCEVAESDRESNLDELRNIIPLIKKYT